MNVAAGGWRAGGAGLHHTPLAISIKRRTSVGPLMETLTHLCVRVDVEIVVSFFDTFLTLTWKYNKKKTGNTDW